MTQFLFQFLPFLTEIAPFGSVSLGKILKIVHRKSKIVHEVPYAWASVPMAAPQPKAPGYVHAFPKPLPKPTEFRAEFAHYPANGLGPYLLYAKMFKEVL